MGSSANEYASNLYQSVLNNNGAGSGEKRVSMTGLNKIMMRQNELRTQKQDLEHKYKQLQMAQQAKQRVAF